MSHQLSKSNDGIVEDFYMQFCHSVPDEGIKFSHSMQGQEAIDWLRTILEAKDAEREKKVEEERRKIREKWNDYYGNALEYGSEEVLGQFNVFIQSLTPNISNK